MLRFTQIPKVLPASLIPGQTRRFRDFFKFHQWQAIGWVRWLYYSLILMNFIINIIVIITAYWHGQFEFIVALCLFPLLWFLGAIGARVFCELALAILLIPYLFHFPGALGSTTGMNLGEGGQELVMDDQEDTIADLETGISLPRGTRRQRDGRSQRSRRSPQSSRQSSRGSSRRGGGAASEPAIESLTNPIMI